MEEWGRHPTIPECRVSTRGQVVVKGRPKPIRVSSHGRPYFEVARRRFYVHHVVLETFVGPRPEGMHALHRDDDPVNNRASNLYWGHPVQNLKDRAANRPDGWSVPRPKLTEADVIEIRSSNLSANELARRYGVAHSTIRKVLSGQTWKHLL